MKGFPTLLFSADKCYYLGIIAFCIALTVYSLSIPFFWDNVYLVSKMAHYYYKNTFPTVVLPLELDSGHPPFYPIYIAVIWSYFGKTLAVSHWAVFPFLVGIGIAYYHLARYFLPPKALLFALLLLALEPTLLGQSVLGGIDISLTCLFLVALNGIFYRKRWLLSIALCGMAAISLRGIIGVGLLGLTEFFVRILDSEEWRKSKQGFFIYFICTIKKIIVAYLPPIILIISWLYYHYEMNGFLTSNPDSPWANGYGFVTMYDWIRNLMFMAWRILDYGRLILWGITFLLVIGYFWRLRESRITNIEYRTPNIEPRTPNIQYPISNLEDQVPNNESPIVNLQSLILYTILPLVFYLPFVTLRYTDILHRYFLPTYLLVSILFVALWFRLEGRKLRLGVLTLVIGGLLSGHFWQYPDRFPNGSDASLAFVPYFELEEKMRAYIEGKEIPFEEVGAEFPAVNPRKFTHLEKGDNLQSFSDKDTRTKLTDFTYILESNLMNNFDIKHLNELRAKNGDWKLEKEWSRGQVYMRLYTRKEP